MFRMRILAVDFGEKRIGLAVSDESGAVVVPVGAIVRTSDAQAAAAVAEAARAREAARLVVGLPRGLDGREGAMARRVRNFARRLEEASGLPVAFHGEALTSAAADAALDEAGVRGAARAAARDAEAAAEILRDFLASGRAGAGAA